jgi:site-specific DNA-cytosine methylase
MVGRWENGVDGKGWDYKSSSTQPYPNPDVYVIGPPCTPFSWLHLDTQLYEEEAAGPLLEALRTIKARRPRISIIENVMGLLRERAKQDLDELIDDLRNHDFHVITLAGLSPDLFGIPLTRKRVYFVISDTRQVNANFERVVLKIMKALQKPGLTNTFMDLLDKRRTRMGSAPSSAPCTCSIASSCPRLA